jgi:hypothetical protein
MAGTGGADGAAGTMTDASLEEGAAEDLGGGGESSGEFGGVAEDRVIFHLYKCNKTKHHDQALRFEARAFSTDRGDEQRGLEKGEPTRSPRSESTPEEAGSAPSVLALS